MENNSEYCPNTSDHRHSWTYIKHIKGYTLAKCSDCYVMHKLEPVKEVPIISSAYKIENHFLILVTVYNAEKYIRDCINSIMTQTYKNYTLLIIDDCSTDNTARIIKSSGLPCILNKKR